MPPKRAAIPKPPVVVGTVSTRSTKRESVVNIEIIPKTTKTTRRSYNKLLKGSPKPERTSPRKTPKTPQSEHEVDDVTENSIKGNPAVLDLLKDWSDEDSNSSPSSIIPVSSESSSDYHIVFEEMVSQESSNLLSADQQSLIEILEGTQEGTPQSSPKVTKESLLQNNYRNSGSIEIIEESVIGDGAIIIESSENNLNSVEDSNVQDIKIKSNNKIEDDKEVEIVSKYKYSEIPLHLQGKTCPDTENLPMKKRLLQVVLQKKDTNESEICVEPSSSHIKSADNIAMEVDQVESLKPVDFKPAIKFQPTEKQFVDDNVQLVQETVKNIAAENENLTYKKSEKIESIEYEEFILNRNNGEPSEIPVETMEICEEHVINEEVIDSQLDITDIDSSNVELSQLTGVDPNEADQSYAESVKDLERILSDEPEIIQLKENQEETIDILEKEKESSRNKKEGKKEKLQIETNISENLEKLKASPSVKGNISPGKLQILDMPYLEDKSTGKKSFSDALSRLDAVPCTPKSKKSSGKWQRFVSDISPRTRRSQKFISEAFDKLSDVKNVSFDNTSPGKLKKSISETCVTDSSKNESKTRNIQSEPVSPKHQIEVELKNDSSFGKGRILTKDSLKDDLKPQVKANSFTEVSTMEVDEIKSDKVPSFLADIPCSFKSKSELKRSIDLKVETSSTKLLSAEEILENIYHPKPQVKPSLTKSVGEKVEKVMPRLQTAEDILASIYNPKPQLIISQTSPSDSSNSEEKKENEPLTPIAEGTFDFEEISSSSSVEVRKTLDKFDERDLTSASETENMGEVNSSFGDLSLNAEKKTRGRPKKIIQQGTRKSSRNKEKEDEIPGTQHEDLKMDTAETTEDSSNSGTQIETLVDIELKNLEELNISLEMLSDKTETRPKTPKLSKKIFKEGKSGRELKGKLPKESKKKKKGNEELSNDKRSESAEDLRRSSRIKTIAPVKKKSHGLVKSKSEPILNESDVSDNSSINESEKSSTPTVSPKPVVRERKTRWSSTKESLPISPLAKTDNYGVNSNPVSPVIIKPEASSTNSAAIIKQRLKSFIHLKENQFKTDRQVSKEAKEMICDCYLAEEDIKKDEYGCGEDCLNRLLMIECGELCQVGGRCTNKRFQNKQMAPVEVFHTDKKGLGIKAAANIPYGEFILEYVGEVLGKEEFDKRAEIYSEDKNIHHYFMSLRPDAIIDATLKGNISRFINHSCEPNAETQKWTVNGELRIGFFSTRTILAGEEITFDYQFERYGREAQKCYCEAPSCRGWLGDSPDASEDEEEEEETQKSLEKVVKKDDRIAQSIESAITAALAAEFGSEASEEPSDKITDIERETDEAATPTAAAPELQAPIKPKKKLRKDIFEDLDQLKEELEILATTGLKNQQHTLKLSRLMVRAKDPEQRKKLLHILRRGELSCRRLFLDYHGLRLIHGYIVDAEQLAKADKQFESSKLELLQTLAVLPIQNRTILIESKVLPAVELMSGKHEDKFKKKESLSETEEEIRFLAKKLLEGWMNLKESFRIPKRQRIEQMKEHEKEANKKFMESRNRIEEEENYRKSDARYRSTWSRYKSERESSNKKGSKQEDKDKPSAEFLRISKQERRKLFALQMELKEHERRLKQREMWRQHEMNCMMIGADPRFTAPFDPSKGFQYVWNPSIGQWQALPAPVTQDVYARSQGTHADAQNWGAYPGHSMISTIPMLPSTHAQLPGLNIPGLQALPEVTQPPLPVTPPVFLDVKKEEEDPSQVKFAGPIPPPAKLPPKWKCAKDKYGRPYYYHIKNRKSQWEPPPLPEEVKLPESPSESSSSESSSLSSDSSSDSDSDGDVDDDKLLLEVRKQIDTNQTISQIKKEEDLTPSPEVKAENSEEDETMDQSDLTMSHTQEPKELSWLDIRLKEQFNMEADDQPPHKKKRPGLCTEIIISPRTQEDRLQFKEDIKRYKANKEKLKRQKELQGQRTKKKKLKIVLGEGDTKKLKVKHLRTSTKSKIKEIQSTGDDAKKIKETFRTSLAGTVVNVLNAYRKPDCKVAKITNTDDFKHLARKLTHFVMLKELKHLDKIEDLTCTDSVKAKAREYIKKYMSKFGELYYKRHDEPDFKD